MTSATFASLLFTVAMLVNMGYFLLGGLPLLILKHDEPMDARFVRSFFDLHYRAAFWVAIGAAVSYALWGRYVFAIGAAILSVAATLLRKYVLPLMQQLGRQIESGQAEAVQRFRRIHTAVLLINLAQLVVVVWGLLALSRAMSA
ncbi:hypothetical protein [Acidovorax sp. BL-A-41-H1]|uniref:hypothetical protein n=1 Tax=Acidovorax sp. BL-A-41-H1 TaxID=3421102 RepID=UPI003F7AB552